VSLPDIRSYVPIPLTVRTAPFKNITDGYVWHTALLQRVPGRHHPPRAARPAERSVTRGGPLPARTAAGSAALPGRAKRLHRSCPRHLPTDLQDIYPDPRTGVPLRGMVRIV
jgi:hypothetical protein